MNEYSFKDVVIDRIGVNDTATDYLSSWNVMLQGESCIRTIHRISLIDARHLPITKPGDRVRLAMQGDDVKGFANLSILEAARKNATPQEIESAARCYLVAPRREPWWHGFILTIIGLAAAAAMVFGTIWITKSSTDEMKKTLKEAQRASAADQEQINQKIEADGRIALARNIISRCAPVSDKAEDFLADGVVDRDEEEVLDTLLRRARADEGIERCPVKAPLGKPSGSA